MGHPGIPMLDDPYFLGSIRYLHGRLFSALQIKPGDIITIFSIRQSFSAELFNRMKGNPHYAHQVIPGIAALSGAHFCPLLTPDIDHSRHPGETYRDMLRKLKPLEHMRAIFLDPSKLMILYAQIHHIAMAYPDEEITFTVFDDCASILSLS